MTNKEAQLLVQQLQIVFDVVTIIDPATASEIAINDAGDVEKKPCHYCAFFNETQCSKGCIASNALAQKGKVVHFESTKNHIFQIITKYLEIDGVPCVLAISSQVSRDVLFTACEEREVIEAYTKKLYIDPLTGTYNRIYYEEHVRPMTNIQAVAMMDADNFKQINDTYGHLAGDHALHAIGTAIQSCLRTTDIVIRYGGDEFLLVFTTIPQRVFSAMLERIRKAVYKTVLPKYPMLQLSISIGGVYRLGSLEELISEADDQLYRAKITKNCIVLETSKK